jgi:hypothetical protein
MASYIAGSTCEKHVHSGYLIFKEAGRKKMAVCSICSVLDFFYLCCDSNVSKKSKLNIKVIISWSVTDATAML